MWPCCLAVLCLSCSPGSPFLRVFFFFFCFFFFPPFLLCSPTSLFLCAFRRATPLFLAVHRPLFAFSRISYSAFSSTWPCDFLFAGKLGKLDGSRRGSAEVQCDTPLSPLPPSARVVFFLIAFLSKNHAFRLFSPTRSIIVRHRQKPEPADDSLSRPSRSVSSPISYA